MTKVNKGVLAGSTLFIISLLFFIQSLKYPYSSDIGPGPGFFPVWLSGILMLLSLFYVIEAYKGDNVSEEKWPQQGDLKNILAKVVGLFVFSGLLYLVGYFPAGVVFLFFMFYKAFKWYTNICISLGVTFFLFWLFSTLLGVPLPVHGILF